MDAYAIYRPLLDLIARSEGTADPARGYNETLAYGALTGGEVDLVRMTLDEVDALQGQMLRHPDNRWRSSACGRYQIVRTTLRYLRQELGLSGHEKFDAGLQDRLACFLLGRRGIERFLSGELKEGQLVDALAREWASLPTTSGKGAYAGQKCGTTLAELQTVLRRMRENPREDDAFGWVQMLFRFLAQWLPWPGHAHKT